MKFIISEKVIKVDGVTPDDDFGPFPGRAKLLSDQNIVCSRVFVFSICNNSKYNYSVLSPCLLDTSVVPSKWNPALPLMFVR